MTKSQTSLIRGLLWKKLLLYENLRKFTYVNDAICKKPIKGIVISFLGLGASQMYGSDFTDGEFYAEKGILYVVPYNNPWAWMNKQAVSYTDEIIDILIEKYNLNKNVPIVSTGESMGGTICTCLYGICKTYTGSLCC